MMEYLAYVLFAGILIGVVKHLILDDIRDNLNNINGTLKSIREDLGEIKYCMKSISGEQVERLEIDVNDICKTIKTINENIAEMNIRDMGR